MSEKLVENVHRSILRLHNQGILHDRGEGDPDVFKGAIHDLIKDARKAADALERERMDHDHTSAVLAEIKAEHEKLLERVKELEAVNTERWKRLEIQDGSIRLTRDMLAARDARIERLEGACVQARGALRLDAMVDENGVFYGTTGAALDAIEAALRSQEPTP